MLTFFSKTIGLSLFFLVSCASLSMAQDIPWQTDLATANSMAARQGKLVWLHFTADWCRPCKTLETFVFSSTFLQDTIDKNVIPVKVDVDLQTELVAEYGISGVPADVVITPAGRVVTKRNSPSTIDDYTKMINGLDKTLAGMDQDHPGIANELAELKEQLEPKNIAGQNDFEPAAPSYQAPRITADGAMLAKNNSRVLENPFVQPSSEKSPVAISPKSENSVVIKNDFVPNASQSSGLVPIQPSNQIAQAAIRMPVAPDQQQRSTFAPQPATRQPKPTGSALAKIKDQPITNQFFERERVANLQSDAMAQAAQQFSPESQNQFEPARTIQQVNTSQASKAQNEPGQTDRSKFALHGKCPVTLMTESRWVDGDPKFGCVHRGRTYLFVTIDHLQMFQAAPDKYSPLLAGYDPVIYHERGDLVEGLEVHGVFMGNIPNQRIVLFSSAETRAKFEDRLNTKNYVETVRQAMLSTKGAVGTELR